MIATQIRKSVRRVVAGSIAALLLTLLAFHFHFNLASATSIHLFLVVLIALRWGFLEAGIVSILSTACLDFFFTDPLFAFTISDSHDFVSLLTFEAAALLVSRLSNQATLHAQASELHQQRLQRLYELSQHVLVLDRMGIVEQQLVDLIRFNLQVEGVALWTARDLRLCRSGVCGVTDDAIHTAFETGSDIDDPGTRTSLRIVRSGTRPIGVLVCCGHTLDVASMNAATSLAAVAIERARSFSTEANAEAARQSEQLRSTILDGLAHAFKSPLTTIMVSSSGLLAMNTLSGVEKRLVGMIDRHASQLSDLTNHLLLTASLDRADLKLSREIVDLDQLIESSVEGCSVELRSHAIERLGTRERSSVYADRKLLQMAIVQILDNAAKYGAPGSSLLIGVTQQETHVAITIHNQGSFIPPEEREKVFQRFYRCTGSSGAVSGTGIGLSVVRRIAEAHHGSVSVESDRASGTTFAITLPHDARRNETCR
jgi:two-component system sensor histidine kinase KdpD